uniref:Uncharacterized protein LOC114330563 isoform X7 n=1 Tax=Diabrotica virgifera virgifera TaxID=50390 RepID=A0A6P7FLA8_DIAVI
MISIHKSLLFVTLVIALVSTVLSENKISKNEECTPTFCDDKRFKCVAYDCSADQILTRIPELCRCCPRCYNKINEGDKCGDNDEAICDQGLTCRNNVCRKEAEPL